MKDDHIYALRLKKEQIERLDWLKERLDNGCSRISWASIINYAVEELYAREENTFPPREHWESPQRMMCRCH